MLRPRTDLAVITAAFEQAGDLEHYGGDRLTPLWEAALAITGGANALTAIIALALVDAYNDGDTPAAAARKVYTSRFRDEPRDLLKADFDRLPVILDNAADPLEDEYEYVVAVVHKTVEPATGIVVPPGLLNILGLGGFMVPRIQPASLRPSHTPRSPIAYLRASRPTHRACPLAALLTREHDVPTYVGIQVSRLLLGTAASDDGRLGSSSALVAHYTGVASPAAARLWAAALTRAIHHQAAAQARESAVRTATRATARRAA